MSWAFAERLRWGVAAILAVALAACSGDPASPQQQIRAVVSALEEAIESRDLADAADYLHADYQDALHKGRGAAMRTLFGYSRRHSTIHLFTLVRSVDVAADGGRADAVVLVAMTGVPAESVDALVSLKADLYRFDVELVRDDGRWVVMHSRWERADPGALL